MKKFFLYPLDFIGFLVENQMTNRSAGQFLDAIIYSIDLFVIPYASTTLF